MKQVKKSIKIKAFSMENSQKYSLVHNRVVVYPLNASGTKAGEDYITTSKTKWS